MSFLILNFLTHNSYVLSYETLTVRVLLLRTVLFMKSDDTTIPIQIQNSALRNSKRYCDHFIFIIYTENTHL